MERLLKRHFTSSSSSASATSSSNPNNHRVPTTIYRRLLAWCREYEDVPFDVIPPATLHPPQVNRHALKRLMDYRTYIYASSHDIVDENPRRYSTRWNHPAHHAMYNENVRVTRNMITFPEIHDANELRAVIRSIYWLNNTRTNANTAASAAADEDRRIDDDGEDVIRERISLAFDALRSCNQLSSNELDGRRSKREHSIDIRRGITGEGGDGNVTDGGGMPNVVGYHVGQVVRHVDGWRGVIVGWTTGEDGYDGRRGSLTTKRYSLEEAAGGVTPSTTADDGRMESKVRYTVLVDSNDANLSHSSKTVVLESEGDLRPVDDPCLQRIHNGLIKQYFARFAGGHYVPNRILSYVYPLDRYSECIIHGSIVKGGTDAVELEQRSSELSRSRSVIADGMRNISSRLVSSLSEESMTWQQVSIHEDISRLISSLRSSAESIAIGLDAPPNPDRDVFVSLARLYAFHVKVNSMLWTRRANHRDKSDIDFSLGQVVRHKIYGFRGLVAAWDTKPRMDVSNWDGLSHIERPEEKPFYHIYPDANDCIKAFGGTRSFRYVCQDNLELCPVDDPLDFEMTLDPDEWKWDCDVGRYTPSMEMKFLYAENIGEHAVMLEETFRDLRKVLNECMLGIRDGGMNGIFSIDDLFYQLKFGAENLDDATIVQDFITDLWKESPNCDLRNQLDYGISDLMEGKHESALRRFSEIVESDPMYGDAWNKKATVLYMMGQTEDSLKSAKEALLIDGRNFQALAGIGLIEMDRSHYDKAIQSYRECLSINPWMGSVSSRLSACLSKIDNDS